MRRETSSMSEENSMSEIFIIEGRKASWTYDEACREFKAPNLHTHPSRLWYGKILSTHWLFFSHFIHVFLCCSILISEIDFLSANLFFCTPPSMILTLADSTLAASRRFLVCSSSCELLLLRFCAAVRWCGTLWWIVFCVSLLLARNIFFTQAAIFFSVRCDDIKDTFNKEKKNFY